MVFYLKTSTETRRRKGGKKGLGVEKQRETENATVPRATLIGLPDHMPTLNQ